MKVKMKQNKNTPVVRVASAALAAFVLLFSLCVPSFADFPTSFEDQPLPLVSNPNVSNISEQFLGFSDHSDSRTDIEYYFSSSNYNSCFIFAIISNNIITPYVCSDQNDSVVTRINYVVSNNSIVSTTPFTISNFNSESDLYYRDIGITFSSDRDVSYYIPSYNSLNDGLLAVKQLISGGASHSLSTSLPAGNAIIIDISGNAGEVLSLSTSSALRHKSPWSDGNQTMNYTDTAPSSISTPYGSTISWTGSGNPNLFGGYNTWILNGPLNPSKSYLVIVNPAYPNDNPDSITSNQASNGPIHISCAYCKGYTFVPLSSYWNNGSIANESGSTRLDGEYDEATQSWVTTNPATGEPQNPVSGGMTDVDAEHITINDWLQNISHQIGSFFSGAIGAVSNLVGAGSDFIQSLSSLYSWLPGPVYAVLSSALILVITIGVIKVFI